MTQSFLLGKTVDSDLDALFKRSHVEQEQTTSSTSTTTKTSGNNSGPGKATATSNSRANVSLDPATEAAAKARSFAQSLKNPDAKKLKSKTTAATIRPSINPTSFSKSKSTRPVLPREEDSAKGDRTLFIGNCPISCFQSHSSQKALKRHLLGCLPQSFRSFVTIESVRFRNLPLTSAIPAKSHRDASKKEAEIEVKENEKEKDEENHARKRARIWKENEVADDEDHEAVTEKPSTVFLTPAQRRKLAYIKSDVHSSADSCTAYIVFTLKKDEDADDAVTVESVKVQWIQNADGTVFSGKTLRVDSATSRVSEIRNRKTAGQVDSSIAELHRVQAQEDQRSVFVGGLDFAESEENLRTMLESLLKEARGSPPSAGDVMSSEDDEDESEEEDEESKDDSDSSGDDNTKTLSEIKKKPTWVKRVRIVRDKDTSLNKGFAYVLLENAECVDELLAMDSSKLKLSKRKLRLERCKSSIKQQQKKLVSSKEKEDVSKGGKKRKNEDEDQSGNIKVNSIKKEQPKESKSKPTLAQKRDVAETAQWAAKLAKISKDERRAIKSSDEVRLARRAEKKRTKIAEQKNIAEIEKSKKSSKTKHRPQQNKKHRMRSDRAELRKNIKK